MGAPPSAEEVADALANPAMAQVMNEALNNPQVVDMMIQNMPMLRDNPQAREIIQSPLFRSMLTDRNTILAAAQLRRAMEGGGGASAFPAPGATDNTPTGDSAAGGQGGNTAPNPWANLGMFGMPGAGAGAGLGAGAGAANPFMALLNPLSAPPAAQPSATSATSGDTSTQRDATATPGSATAGQPGGNNNPAANPFAGLFAPPSQQMMQQFMQMMASGGGGGVGAPAAPADNRPPEERYAEQLSQLNEMGFYNFDQNVAALRRSGGNVQGAVNFLLGG